MIIRPTLLVGMSKEWQNAKCPHVYRSHLTAIEHEARYLRVEGAEELMTFAEIFHGGIEIVQRQETLERTRRSHVRHGS